MNDTLRSMDDLTPAEFIRKELERRCWLQRDLAFILGIPETAVGMLITGRRGISAEMAKALAAAFDTSPEYILRLQKTAEVAAELSRARSPDPSIARKARIASLYPVREMVKRGWIDVDPAKLEMEVASFFGVGSPDELPQMQHAAKKTTYQESNPHQLAWLFRARAIAREMVVSNYSEKALRQVVEKLRPLMSAPEEVRHVPRLLSDCGVRYVLVESLPNAKIDGACFWVCNGQSPVIAMTLRFDRIDNYWFVLRHEIEHVLAGDGKHDAMVDVVELDGGAGAGADALPACELHANAVASDFCVPKAQLESWVARKHPFYSEVDLIGFSRRLGVHPGIVAGQLRHRTKNYKLFAKFLAKVRPAVASSAVVDGWGQVAPVSSTAGGER